MPLTSVGGGFWNEGNWSASAGFFGTGSSRLGGVLRVDPAFRWAVRVAERRPSRGTGHAERGCRSYCADQDLAPEEVSHCGLQWESWIRLRSVGPRCDRRIWRALQVKRPEAS